MLGCQVIALLSTEQIVLAYQAVFTLVYSEKENNFWGKNLPKSDILVNWPPG